MNCIDLTVAARCLAGVGVTPGYSLDSVGREQFHSLSPRSEMSSKPPAWLTKYSYHRLQDVSLYLPLMRPGEGLRLFFSFFKTLS